MKQTIAQFLSIKDFPFIIKDKNGNTIYCEWCDNYWVKHKYDENNNKIYFEDFNGYWSKSKYDENNNEICYKTSMGYWIKREYDNNNDEIYYEDSGGRIVNHRPYKSKNSCNNKIVEIDGKKYKLKEIN